MQKRVLSLLLTIAMVLSLGVSAFAASNSMSNFTKGTTYNNNFTDVAASAWYAGAVKTCYEYGLMKGSDTTRFYPDGSLTVAEALVMADRLHALFTTGKNTLTNGSPWYQPYVDYALKNGIIQTKDFSDYTAKISRADMAYLFSNALPASQLSAINTVSVLPDVTTATTTHAAEILRLYGAGVLTGADRYGTFSPNTTIKRSEAATILSRMAIPANRKTFTLYEQCTFGSSVIDVPAGSSKNVTATVAEVTSRDGNFRIDATMDTQSSYAGYTISHLSKDSALEMAKTRLTDLGVTVAGSTVSTVSFGSTQAYRIKFTASANSTPVSCYAYFYYYSGTFSMVLVRYYGDYSSPILSTAVNSLTVGNKAVSPKI